MGSQEVEQARIPGAEEASVPNSDELQGFQGFSAFSCFVVTINMIVGAGILGLPYAFFQAGAGFSILVLTFATLLTAITVGYLIECLGWAEGYLSAPQPSEGVSLIQPEGKDKTKEEEESEEQVGEGSETFIIRRRKFEMTELCGIFLGIKVSEESWFARFADAQGYIHPYRNFLEVALCLYTFGSCWLYATVFASTLSSLIPIPWEGDVPPFSKCWNECVGKSVEMCNTGCAVVDGACQKDATMFPYCWTSYRFFLGIFGLVQLVLCVVDLNSFKNLQVVMSVMAFCSIATMVATSLVAAENDTGPDRGYNHIPPFQFSGLMNIVTSGLFAQECHSGVPTVVMMMKNKKQAKPVFAAALAYTLSIYVVLSISTTYYFGPRTNPVITLNWASYTGGAQGSEHVPTWARAISFIVMVFPVISVTAAFSLLVLPTAETVYAMLPEPSSPEAGERTRVLLKLVWSLTPIFCSSFERDIQDILDFVGLIAFFTAFFIPCALQIAARNRCVKAFGPSASKTPYSDLTSSRWVVWIIVVLAIVLMVLVTNQILHIHKAEAVPHPPKF